MAEGLQLEAAVLGSFSDVEAAAWDRIVAGEPPFLEHAFLWGLEDTGCVGADTGWLPRPVVVRSGGELLGIAPAWLKAHSMGEFVYDWAWADAAQRAGVRYYPKLIVAAPFSPVPGSRLLVDPALPPALADAVRTMLLDALETVARDSGAAGLHLLFCRPEEVRLCTERGYAHRVGMQFHWQNAGYADFEDFLARFRSKQRNQIRRERRQVAEQGVVVEALTGAEIPDALCGPAYGWYCATIERFFYGRQYLNEAFFQRLWEQMRPRLQLVVARHQGEPIAGSVNLQKGDERYGRYWGASERYSCVHFEVCTYTAVEDCIRQGIQTFQAGAGGGEHKYGRGFAPALTHSVHRLHHPGFQEAVEEFCTREATLVRAEADRLTEELFVR
ncbi:MAG: GNAT family N-acetyltransferase [Alphaproteobacteria bacterium]|nr:GNAT family N-acetyltransferase [Alphaproteobacteria bacterium]